MIVRLDFVSVDDFLRLNPQYTKEERKEILALNTLSAPVIDRTFGNTDDYGSRFERILDKEEIAAFFQSHPDLTYGKLFYAWSVAHKSFRGFQL